MSIAYDSPPGYTMQTTSTFHQQIASAIIHSPHFDCRRIKVRTNQGQVVLSGSTDSFFEKQMAQEALRGIENITLIRNELKVEQLG